MSAKVSNDFSTHTRKDSCRSNSCVSACLCCVSASRHSVPSCRRSRIRRMTVPHSCAWQKPSSHFLPACAALQRRLASLNVRKSRDCWLKTFWWAKIQLRFVTAFQSPRAHPQTKGRALLSAEITFCVRGVISPLLANIYLHYVFDLWVDAWRRKCARGDVVVVPVRRRQCHRLPALGRRRPIPDGISGAAAKVWAGTAPRQNA